MRKLYCKLKNWTNKISKENPNKSKDQAYFLEYINSDLN